MKPFKGPWRERGGGSVPAGFCESPGCPMSLALTVTRRKTLLLQAEVSVCISHLAWQMEGSWHFLFQYRRVNIEPPLGLSHEAGMRT